MSGAGKKLIFDQHLTLHYQLFQWILHFSGISPLCWILCDLQYNKEQMTEFSKKHDNSEEEHRRERDRGRINIYTKGLGEMSADKGYTKVQYMHAIYMDATRI